VVTIPAKTLPYRVLLPASADRADWLRARRLGIGSSDVAAALGVSTHGSAQHVYYDKRGLLPLEDDAGEAALWGTLLEETVAREWARRNRATVRRVGLVARKDAPHRMCTLDRLSRACPLDDAPEQCGVEIKTRNAYVAGKWKRGIPDDVLAQVLWQIHVTGYDHVHVACLIGGQEYRQYVIRRRDHLALIADIVTGVDRLWSDIQAGRVPALTGSEPVDPMLDLFDQLHPYRDGCADLDEYDALGVAAGENLLAYEIARLEEGAAKKRKEAAKVALIEALADKQAALLNREIAYELKPTSREKCDLARLADQFPDAYAACVTQTPGKQLAISKQHRLKEIPYS
jgi:putative phage-type endonuclease